jgi:hypothetical protein
MEQIVINQLWWQCAIYIVYMYAHTLHIQYTVNYTFHPS